MLSDNGDAVTESIYLLLWSIWGLLGKTCLGEDQLVLYPCTAILLAPIFPGEIADHVITDNSVSSREGVLI